jgi:GAF domain-containing protein
VRGSFDDQIPVLDTHEYPARRPRHAGEVRLYRRAHSRRETNTFHRHSIDAETEAAIPPDPELAMEESDAWWVYQHQEFLITSLEARDARCSKFQEILKKYGIRCACTLPLTTAHSKVGTLTFASKAPDIYTAEEVCFLSVVAEQIALAFDNALHFDASQASQATVAKKERAGWTSPGVDQSRGFQS